MAVETENFKGKHRNLKVSSERYLWKLSKVTVIRKVFFSWLKKEPWTKLKKDKSERNYHLENDFHQEIVFLRASNDCQTVQNTHWVTIVWLKKKRSNDETENERNEAIESVSVIDGLITSRIVYENNTVND